MFFSRKERALTPSQPFRIAVAGNGERNEFLPVRSAIAALTEISLFRDFSAISPQICHDLLFLLESRPGEYHEQEILKYRKQSPLCRMVLIVGALAEGEKRTGYVPDGVFRYYTWQLQSVIRELDRFLHNRKTVWNGPLTMAPEEVALHQVDAFRDMLRNVSSWKKKVSIVSADLPLKEWLEDSCRKEHYRITPEKDVPDLVLLDDTGLSTDDLVEKLHFHRMHNRNVHLFILANAPRWDEKRKLHENGADRIFAKPFF